MQSLYPSNGFVDELAWAAAWLYSASNSTASNYLSDARRYYGQAVAQQVGGVQCRLSSAGKNWKVQSSGFTEDSSATASGWASGWLEIRGSQACHINQLYCSRVLAIDEL